ncbi:regulatory protein RecX [Cohnella nanjingensis]|uniref:Regulatory protein RecX n=1 Tax=Cohnella nanjingensis TaxID=1387779 RepID=A0A7X0RSE3_9BACL|nr:RecX family transcriptional regulator [Cohnella nanjingensis]MBB6672839.1 RecX family transcriptional regulator [Cohnella nanjingensis]
MSKEERADRESSEASEAIDISDERDWRVVGKAKPPSDSGRRSSGNRDAGARGGSAARNRQARSQPHAQETTHRADADRGIPDHRHAPNTGAVIVAMQADPKKPSMYVLAVLPEGSSEQETLKVHEDTLVGWRLLKGRRLTAEEWAELRKEEQKEEAYRAALGMLDFKARTKSELQKGLKRKGFSAEAIAGSLERLSKHGLLDDAAYAKRFAESRVSSQKKGRRLIRQELLQRGVGKQDVEEALEDLDADAERSSALTLARKRWPGIKGKTLRERQMKLLGVLLRRGFPNGVAYEAVREAAAELPPEEEADWEESSYGEMDHEDMDI